jgi:hypothetical protein
MKMQSATIMPQADPVGLVSVSWWRRAARAQTRAVLAAALGLLPLLGRGQSDAPAAAVVPPAPAVQPATQPIPAARWTLAQLRQAYDLADTDSDGRLSRAEAQRLAIMPRSFEDLDLNKDGVLERGEYEGSIAK